MGDSKSKGLLDYLTSILVLSSIELDFFCSVFILDATSYTWEIASGTEEKLSFLFYK